MPIYEYKCQACGHYLEALQKLNEAPLTQCPECGQPALHKLISAAGFRLKGSGWYETDFKSGKKRNVAENADKPAASPPPKTGKAENKPEAKPAAKADAKKPASTASS